MVESKPNKKFLYYEDNGDGTCLVTLSVPEDDIFSSAIIQMSLEDLFDVGVAAMTPELHQHVSERVVVVPNSTEGV